MAGPDRQYILKGSVSAVFICLLALPVLLPKLSSLKDKNRFTISSDSAIKRFGFYLEEISDEAGIKFYHQSPVLDNSFDHILPLIASTGASVSVTDFDKDGWNDIYVTNSRLGSKNALYHNRQDGTFTDEADNFGIADVNREGLGVSMGSVWADYDNDGFEDLFIYKWGKPELFKNDQGNRFINVTDQCGLPRWINASTAIWLDYNSDGYIDLFIGGYFPDNIDLWNLQSTRILTESFEYSNNGGRNFLLMNNGNGTFTDVTKITGLTSTKWTMAAGSADVNNDGFPELIIANEYSIDEFYLNVEGKYFINKSENTMIGFSPESGMNVSFGDVFNNGEFGIYVSNITEDGVLLQGNNFWVPVGENKKLLYINTASELGIEKGGWCYGAQFGDLNNDGYNDLYVANGFVSGKNKTSYWYDFTKVTGGNSSIISDIKNWPSLDGRSLSGFQQNKIWLNNGTGYFAAIEKYVAKSETMDSRAVSFADLWNRGAIDIIIANQDNKLLVYKNFVDTSRHWIAFELEGTKSNRSAIGAILKLHWNKQTQAQILTGGIGFCSQNQHRLYFGIGKSSSVEKAIITWPDGNRQVIYNPAINRINYVKEKI